MILSLCRQRQVDFFVFKASLVYRVNARTVGVTQRNCLKTLMTMFGIMASGSEVGMAVTERSQQNK